MWAHPATEANMASLRGRGVLVAGPGDGAMAEAESGPGRLMEPADLLAAIRAALVAGPLTGRHLLVTSGPTHEPIDPVRYIANRSSGKQGFAIAAAAAELGARVTLVAGPVHLPTPPGVDRIDVESAREMAEAVKAALPADAAVMVAAVADWRPAQTSDGKLKKMAGQGGALDLVENPDILKTLSAPGAARPRLVVGFAAETETLLDHAAAKLDAKGCDWIVANDVSQPGVMGGADNTVLLVTAHGAEPWPTLSKTDVARRLADRIATALA